MLIAGRQPMQFVKIAFLALALHFGILELKMLDIHLALGAAQAESASAHAIAAGQRLLEGIGQPGASGIMEEIAVYRGDWAGMIAHKASNIWGWEITGLLYMSLDTLGFMLLGMAMLKGDSLVANGRRSNISAPRGIASSSACRRCSCSEYGHGAPALMR